MIRHKLIGGLKVREWLRKLRKSKKLSEIETARLAGIAQPFYHNIEMGIKNPSVDTAKRIAAVLGFHWTQFFPDSDDKTEAV